MNHIGWGQQQEYKLLSNDREIGRMLVNGTEEKIEINSEVNIKILAKAKVSYALKSNYDDDGLVQSSVITYLNGKEHSNTKMIAQGSGYTMTKNGKIQPIDGKKKYTGAMLYVLEPKDIAYVLSESDGLLRKVEKVGKHHYRLIHPKKKSQVQEFMYKDGVLIEAMIKHPFKTFHILKK
ncbi:DUF6134 family protein [Ulvibacterium sp.]|uniref:DUF6134 family protein n=1 Tax=Ulvibacterium sp. TaxID=2665914 RepID=UPI00262FD6E5|nr:DUF6134 family protein [Ulvibacterium sp.]